MIIALGRQTPDLELFQRFWCKQFNFDVCFRAKLTSILDEMSISYSEETFLYEVDLTECFQNNFEKPHHKCILDIFTQVDTFAYPKSIFQICMDYLRCIAQDQSDAKIHILCQVSFITILRACM